MRLRIHRTLGGLAIGSLGRLRMTRKSLGCVLLLLLLPTCGGGNGPSNATPVTTTTLPACTQTLLNQGSFSATASTLLHILPVVTITSTGRIDEIVDWTFADSHIGVYLVPAGNCQTLAEFNARSCNFLIRSESGSKPRKVSAANVLPGAYQELVANFGTKQEAISTQVFLSSSTCPPSKAARYRCRK